MCAGHAFTDLVPILKRKIGEAVMLIRKTGYNHRHDSDFQIERPHGSGDFLLLLIKSPALFLLDGKWRKAKKESFILYQKDTPQFYRTDGQEFVNDWIHFSAEKEDSDFIKGLHIPFDTIVELSDVSQLSMLVRNVCYEFYSENFYRAEVLQNYLRLLFYKLAEKMRAGQEEAASGHYEKMSLIRSQIYSEPQANWEIGGMAHQLQMSRSGFEHIYRQLFGTSPIQDVIESRVSYGELLLSTTALPVKQIAEICGYKSDVHFMRQFKDKTGKTPTQYRRKE